MVTLRPAETVLPTAVLDCICDWLSFLLAPTEMLMPTLVAALTGSPPTES